MNLNDQSELPSSLSHNASVSSDNSEAQNAPETNSRSASDPKPRFIASFGRTFSALKERNFRLLWVGMVLQMAAMQITQMANGFYVYELTGSATRLGIVTGAAAVPGLLLTLYGGVLADRMEKKRLIQAGQLVFMATTLFVGISVSTGSATWYHLLAASAVFGATMPFLMPARMSIIPQVVSKGKLMNAVALNSLGMSLTTMAAPGLAGVSIQFIGIEGLYYAIGGMYAGAIVFTALLPRYPVETSGPKQSVLTDLGGGIRYLRDNTVILSLLLFGVILMMLAMPLRFVLPVFAKDAFGVGAEGLGAMMSSIGIGSLVGSLGVASLGRVGSRGILLVIAGILMTLAVLMFATVSYWIPLLSLAVICMAAIGLTMAIQMAVHQSLLMEYVEGGFRGRVMSFQGLGFSVMPAVVVPLTLGMEWIGAPLALAVMTLILFTLGLIVFLLSPRLRMLR